ncbi:hypothetical protein MKW94_022927, partial [Papaver nudicaule]|nr:hypothetical protein [Papaver nudicaule]
IDECSDKNLNNCGMGSSCINKEGRFNCSCNKGYNSELRNNFWECTNIFNDIIV